jgi:hypothetical protein
MLFVDDKKTAMTLGIRGTIILGNLSWVFLYLAYEYVKNKKRIFSNNIAQKTFYSK